MKVSSFSEIEKEFIERVHSIVWCNVATVDGRGRPRSRLLHPIWEGMTGWIATHRQSHKSRHLAHNPYVSLAYITDIHRPVYVDCRASWVDDLAEKARIWDLFKATPPPMGFDPVIVFLTAIHFHFAGLILPILTGLAAQKRPGILANVACLGVLGGVPLTAAGITASQFRAGPWLEVFAATWMAVSGLLTAILHVKILFLSKNWSGKWLFGVSSAALATGMLLAFLYGIRSVVPTPGLDIPWMRALHGSLNSIGFAGIGLVGWMFFSKNSRFSEV